MWVRVRVIEQPEVLHPLTPEELGAKSLLSATSTVYTIMAIKLRVEAQHNIGGQLAWS